MPFTADADGSEDVNDFLLRIRELGDQRDKEDEERTRKLEEEIIQGRKERQARRAERARSLSPTKDPSSNAETSGPVPSKNYIAMQDERARTPTLQPAPSPGLMMNDAPQKMNGRPPMSDLDSSAAKPRELPQPPSKPQTLSAIPAGTAMPLARSGTRSWQQRPSSRGSTGSRTRPLSMLGTVSKEGTHFYSGSAAIDHQKASRSQIAQSLGTRDPTWFKQTQNRGLGSAAFRRNQIEETSDTMSEASSIRLPGISRESSTEPENPLNPPLQSIESSPPSVGGPIRGSSTADLNSSGFASTLSTKRIQSPLPTLTSHKFDPPSSDVNSTSSDDPSSVSRTLAMSPSQGRISPERTERPTSPTKGLGGFVQSAMLKRSDSVNKRWSAQAGPGLSRGNSTASNLSGYGGSRYPVGGITPLPESRPSSISREGSPIANPRPTSSHSNSIVKNRLNENEKPGNSNFLPTDLSGPRFDVTSASAPPRASTSPAPLENVSNPPGSPSKRWSPTKSSWLENAINKPDSPKLKSPVPPQPAWMTEINRAKQQRGSVDSGRELPHKEVSIGGLVRSPPPGAGYKPPTIGALHSAFGAGVAKQARNGSKDVLAPRSASPDTAIATGKGKTATRKGLATYDSSVEKDDISEDKADVPIATESSTSVTADRKTSPVSQPGPRNSSPPITRMKPGNLMVSQVSKTDQDTTVSSSTRTKPETPPKKDFKSTLKPRQSPVEKNIREEPEFKNVFGNLKRAQTQKYIAPDELKDNIMRGKAGLAQSAGPQKTERKDEFKQSIVQKKQGMIVPSASTRITSASAKMQEQSMPEAIAKKRGLTRSESIRSNSSIEEEKQLPKAEALTKLQHLRDKPKPTASEKPYVAPTLKQSDPLTKTSSVGDFSTSLAGILERRPSPRVAQVVSYQSTDLGSGIQANAAGSGMVSDSPRMTHATKMRARGPKRRLPTANKQDVAADVPKPGPDPGLKASSAQERPPILTDDSRPQLSPLNPGTLGLKPLSTNDRDNTKNRKPSQPLTPRKSSTVVASGLDIRSASPTTQVTDRAIETKPSPPLSRQKPNPSPEVAKTRPPSIPTTAAFPNALLAGPLTQEVQSGLSRLAEEEHLFESPPDNSHTSAPSVNGTAASWGRSPETTQLSRVRSPVKSPISQDEDTASDEAGLKYTRPAFKAPIQANESSVHLHSPASQSPKSPPAPKKKPSTIGQRISSTTQKRSEQPPISQPSEASRLFADIFEESPNFNCRINIDTQAVIDSRSSNDNSHKSKTLRKQISEIVENGRSVPVSSNQEHILFDESIYLCTNIFGNHAGERLAEVYLWVGDAASSSTLENAKIQAKIVAKENNARLIILKQGKETNGFFQALGGIVITRRGSSKSTSGTRGQYILCGRQHLGGQIAFDEVDYDPLSLCTGFPCIVSSPHGFYLWKGAGSGLPELGCARLVGMDLALSEFKEVDDGQEGEAFWEAFPGRMQETANKRTSSAEHWHLKPSCENYAARLYTVNVETQRPKSASGLIQGAMQWSRRGSSTDTAKAADIKEVVPYVQSDLVDNGIFVLDAFFQLFIIVIVHSLSPPPHKKSIGSLPFRAALLFAQDYGIIAASTEDRPFVPASSVIVCSRNAAGGEGRGRLPEPMVRAFRKWDESVIKDYRILPLAVALEAIGEQR